MRLTYIFHSGFALETADCVLVFDYWLDPADVASRLLKAAKPMYVFASHFHEDHFSPAIFGWRRRHPNIRFILSKDILRHRRAKTEDADAWLAKGGTWEDAHVKVVATGSTDSGVSWIVETGGRRIFHAGDLNNWYARFLVPGTAPPKDGTDPLREEKRYVGELKDIRKVADSFDLVMFPVDGRIGNGYTLGGRQFIERFRVGCFVPMHFVVSGFESAWRMKEFTDKAGVAFWRIRREGESIEF